jgi:CheY-like chemotaxis protein
MITGGARSKIVLIVEDDSHARDMYRTTLAGHGYAVVAVEDGTDALRHLDYRGVDAVVLDLGLPRLGGRDVYAEIRANPQTRNLPVVIVTGMDLSPAEAGDFKFLLRKPFTPEVLAMTLENAMNRRGAGM